MSDVPTTKYATNGDVHFAYQVLDEGPLNLVLIDVGELLLVIQAPTLVLQRAHDQSNRLIG